MQANELKQNRVSFVCPKDLFDDTAEQSVEKDFVLPDYCPDIFRILKCRLLPRVMSHSLSGRKLSFELSVVLKILYESEGSDRPGYIEQKLHYSKTVELPEDAGGCDISLTPVCEHVNCRVVNKRRIDVRGAVSTRIRVRKNSDESFLAGCTGSGVELKTKTVTYPAKRVCSDKRLTIVEEFELSGDKPAPNAVIRSECVIIKGSTKIIKGKAVVKGDAEVSMLYSFENAGKNGCETMKFTIPFSQVVDVDGVDEGFECCADVKCLSCEIMPKGESSKTLECEIVALVSIQAVKFESCEAVEDAYSTKYESTLDKTSVNIESAPVPVETTVSKTAVLSNDDRIGRVYDAWCELSGVSARYDEGSKAYNVTGNARFCLFGVSDGGRIIYAEQEEPIEETVCSDLCATPDSRLELDAAVRNVSFVLKDDTSAEITAQILISGKLTERLCCELLDKITIDTDRPRAKEQSCAVKLCRCDDKTDIWEIAKKYGTSAKAIEQENDLQSSTMLLIPIV
ncbi:MAG: DUF3794 domain-containing protein [Ruminococcus sp.]|nr:DUF3794 domain-containing protein [Ruminococcus sp.]